MKVELFLIDVLVFFSYLSKGMIKAKIQADLEISRNKKIIDKKYHELENIKVIPDEILIEKFNDSIFIPKDVSKDFASRLFNKFLRSITNQTKKRLLSS